MKCHCFSLRDEKVKIHNFAEDIMPEQYNDGWQHKLCMKTHMVEKLVQEIRPYMPKISGNFCIMLSVAILFICVIEIFIRDGMYGRRRMRIFQ